MSSKIKILFIAAGLGRGGAELMLLNILKRLPPDQFDITLVLLSKTTDPALLAAIPKAKVVHANSDGKLAFFTAFIKLFFVTKKIKPQIIQSWMHIPNFYASLIGRCFPKCKIIWGIRRSKIIGLSSFMQRIIKWGAALSFKTHAIISCSERAIKKHIAIGYDASKMQYIPNGVDTDRFRPEQKNNQPITELGEIKKKNGILIGALGRNVPDKDYPTLLSAASIILESNPQAWFVLVGRDTKKLLATHPHIVLINEITAPEYYLPLLDIFVLSSNTEGFPNVVIEAMASGTPCVVTDVGDTQRIVSNTGIIKPSENPYMLAEGIQSLLSKKPEEREALGEQSRKRVLQEFDINNIVNRYYKTYINAAL